MDKERIIDSLIKYFSIENQWTVNEEIPDDEEEKRDFLTNIILERSSLPIHESVVELESRLIQIELQEKGIVKGIELPTVDETLGSDDEVAKKIALWQGDITRIEADAVINPTNPTMLGCKNKHKCIDRKIRTYAGMRLTQECNDIIKSDFNMDVVPYARITNGYNLPCSYVIHITMPKLVSGTITDEDRNQLKKCYLSVLNLASIKKLKTIVIPLLSTDDFKFPKNESAIIAFETIKDYLIHNPFTFDRIVINVHKSEDYNEFKKLL